MGQMAARLEAAQEEVSPELAAFAARKFAQRQILAERQADTGAADRRSKEVGVAELTQNLRAVDRICSELQEARARIRGSTLPPPKGNSGSGQSGAYLESLNQLNSQELEVDQLLWELLAAHLSSTWDRLRERLRHALQAPLPPDVRASLLEQDSIIARQVSAVRDHDAPSAGTAVALQAISGAVSMAQGSRKKGRRGGPNGTRDLQFNSAWAQYRQSKGRMAKHREQFAAVTAHWPPPEDDQEESSQGQNRAKELAREQFRAHVTLDGLVHKAADIFEGEALNSSLPRLHSETLRILQGVIDVRNTLLDLEHWITDEQSRHEVDIKEFNREATIDIKVAERNKASCDFVATSGATKRRDRRAQMATGLAQRWPSLQRLFDAPAPADGATRGVGGASGDEPPEELSAGAALLRQHAMKCKEIVHVPWAMAELRKMSGLSVEIVAQALPHRNEEEELQAEHAAAAEAAAALAAEEGRAAEAKALMQSMDAALGGVASPKSEAGSRIGGITPTRATDAGTPAPKEAAPHKERPLGPAEKHIEAHRALLESLRQQKATIEKQAGRVNNNLQFRLGRLVSRDIAQWEQERRAADAKHRYELLRKLEKSREALRNNQETIARLLAQARDLLKQWEVLQAALDEKATIKAKQGLKEARASRANDAESQVRNVRAMAKRAIATCTSFGLGPWQLDDDKLKLEDEPCRDAELGERRARLAKMSADFVLSRGKELSALLPFGGSLIDKAVQVSADIEQRFAAMGIAGHSFWERLSTTAAAASQAAAQSLARRRSLMSGNQVVVMNGMEKSWEASWQAVNDGFGPQNLLLKSSAIGPMPILEELMSRAFNRISERIAPLPRYFDGLLELHLHLQGLETAAAEVAKYWENAASIEVRGSAYLGTRWRHQLSEAAHRHLAPIRTLARAVAALEALEGAVAPELSREDDSSAVSFFGPETPTATPTPPGQKSELPAFVRGAVLKRVEWAITRWCNAVASQLELLRQGASIHHMTLTLSSLLLMAEKDDQLAGKFFFDGKDYRLTTTQLAALHNIVLGGVARSAALAERIHAESAFDAPSEAEGASMAISVARKMTTERALEPVKFYLAHQEIMPPGPIYSAMLKQQRNTRKQLMSLASMLEDGAAGLKKGLDQFHEEERRDSGHAPLSANTHVAIKRALAEASSGLDEILKLWRLEIALLIEVGAGEALRRWRKTYRKTMAGLEAPGASHFTSLVAIVNRGRRESNVWEMVKAEADLQKWAAYQIHPPTPRQLADWEAVLAGERKLFANLLTQKQRVGVLWSVGAQRGLAAVEPFLVREISGYGGNMAQWGFAAVTDLTLERRIAMGLTGEELDLSRFRAESTVGTSPGIESRADMYEEEDGEEDENKERTGTAEKARKPEKHHSHRSDKRHRHASGAPVVLRGPGGADAAENSDVWLSAGSDADAASELRSSRRDGGSHRRRSSAGSRKSTGQAAGSAGELESEGLDSETDSDDSEVTEVTGAGAEVEGVEGAEPRKRSTQGGRRRSRRSASPTAGGRWVETSRVGSEASGDEPTHSGQHHADGDVANGEVDAGGAAEGGSTAGGSGRSRRASRQRSSAGRSERASVGGATQPLHSGDGDGAPGSEHPASEGLDDSDRDSEVSKVEHAEIVEAQLEKELAELRGQHSELLRRKTEVVVMLKHHGAHGFEAGDDAMAKTHSGFIRDASSGSRGPELRTSRTAPEGGLSVGTPGRRRSSVHIAAEALAPLAQASPRMRKGTKEGHRNSPENDELARASPTNGETSHGLAERIKGALDGLNFTRFSSARAFLRTKEPQALAEEPPAASSPRRSSAKGASPPHFPGRMGSISPSWPHTAASASPLSDPAAAALSQVQSTPQLLFNPAPLPNQGPSMWNRAAGRLRAATLFGNKKRGDSKKRGGSPPSSLVAKIAARRDSSGGDEDERFVEASAQWREGVKLTLGQLAEIDASVSRAVGLDRSPTGQSEADLARKQLAAKRKHLASELTEQQQELSEVVAKRVEKLNEEAASLDAKLAELKAKEEDLQRRHEQLIQRRKSSSGPSSPKAAAGLSEGRRKSEGPGQVGDAVVEGDVESVIENLRDREALRKDLAEFRAEHTVVQTTAQRLVIEQMENEVFVHSSVLPNISGGNRPSQEDLPTEAMSLEDIDGAVSAIESRSKVQWERKKVAEVVRKHAEQELQEAKESLEDLELLAQVLEDDPEPGRKLSNAGLVREGESLQNVLQERREKIEQLVGEVGEALEMELVETAKSKELMMRKAAVQKVQLERQKTQKKSTENLGAMDAHFESMPDLPFLGDSPRPPSGGHDGSPSAAAAALPSKPQRRMSIQHEFPQAVPTTVATNAPPGSSKGKRTLAAATPAQVAPAAHDSIQSKIQKGGSDSELDRQTSQVSSMGVSFTRTREEEAARLAALAAQSEYTEAQLRLEEQKLANLRRRAGAAARRAFGGDGPIRGRRGPISLSALLRERKGEAVSVPQQLSPSEGDVGFETESFEDVAEFRGAISEMVRDWEDKEQAMEVKRHQLQLEIQEVNVAESALLHRYAVAKLQKKRDAASGVKKDPGLPEAAQRNSPRVPPGMKGAGKGQVRKGLPGMRSRLPGEDECVVAGDGAAVPPTSLRSPKRNATAPGESLPKAQEAIRPGGGWSLKSAVAAPPREPRRPSTSYVVAGPQLQLEEREEAPAQVLRQVTNKRVLASRKAFEHEQDAMAVSIRKIEMLTEKLQALEQKVPQAEKSNMMEVTQSEGDQKNSKVSSQLRQLQELRDTLMQMVREEEEALQSSMQKLAEAEQQCDEAVARKKGFVKTLAEITADDDSDSGSKEDEETEFATNSEMDESFKLMGMSIGGTGPAPSSHSQSQDGWASFVGYVNNEALLAHILKKWHAQAAADAATRAALRGGPAISKRQRRERDLPEPQEWRGPVVLEGAEAHATSVSAMAVDPSSFEALIRSAGADVKRLAIRRQQRQNSNKRPTLTLTGVAREPIDEQLDLSAFRAAAISAIRNVVPAAITAAEGARLSGQRDFGAAAEQAPGAAKVDRRLLPQVAEEEVVRPILRRGRPSAADLGEAGWSPRKRDASKARAAGRLAPEATAAPGLDVGQPQAASAKKRRTLERDVPMGESPASGRRLSDAESDAFGDSDDDPAQALPGSRRSLGSWSSESSEAESEEWSAGYTYQTTGGSSFAVTPQDLASFPGLFGSAGLLASATAQGDRRLGLALPALPLGPLAKASGLSEVWSSSVLGGCMPAPGPGVRQRQNALSRWPHEMSENVLTHRMTELSGRLPAAEHTALSARLFRPPPAETLAGSISSRHRLPAATAGAASPPRAAARAHEASSGSPTGAWQRPAPPPGPPLTARERPRQAMESGPVLGSLLPAVATAPPASAAAAMYAMAATAPVGGFRAKSHQAQQAASVGRWPTSKGAGAIDSPPSWVSKHQQASMTSLTDVSTQASLEGLTVREVWRGCLQEVKPRATASSGFGGASPRLSPKFAGSTFTDSLARQVQQQTQALLMASTTGTLGQSPRAPRGGRRRRPVHDGSVSPAPVPRLLVGDVARR